PLAEDRMDFDDSSLLKMTMGDQEMMAKILASFMRDCEGDQDSLTQSIANGNQAEARLVIHRLAGRIAEIGAKDLGAAFRQLEQEVAAVESIGKSLEVKISNLMEQLQLLLKTVNGRIQLVSSDI